MKVVPGKRVGAWTLYIILSKYLLIKSESITPGIRIVITVPPGSTNFDR